MADCRLYQSISHPIWPAFGLYDFDTPLIDRRGGLSSLPPNLDGIVSVAEERHVTLEANHTR